MTVGGLGLYNPKLIGFVQNNAPSTDQLAGWMDTVTRGSGKYQRDVIDGLLHTFAESGAYGVSWTSVASSLPATPALGRTVLRVNTDESNAERLYIYNSESLSWTFFDSIDVVVDDTPVDGHTSQAISSNWAFDHTATVDAHHTKYTDAEVDAIVLTHKNTTDAHHTKYTDAEVDAIVLTHKNISTAHHTKYTDAEATGAVNAVRKVTPHMIVPALGAEISSVATSSPMYGGIYLPASDDDCRAVYHFVLPEGFSSSVTIHIIWTNSTINSYTYVGETGFDNFDADASEVMESGDPPNQAAMSFVAGATLDWEVKEETRNITGITKEFLAVHVGSTATNSSYIIVKAVYLTET